MVSPSIPHLVAALSVAGSLVTAWIALYAWRRRDVAAATPFGALAAVASGWSLCYAGALIAETEGVASTLLTVGDAVGAQIAPLWIVFTIVYTRAERYQRPSIYALVWVVPAAYVLLVATGPIHGLTETSAQFMTASGITAPVLERTGVSVVYTAFSYLLLLGGYLQLVRFLIESRNVYRQQVVVIIIGSVVPLVANAVFAMGLSPHPGLNPTPLSFVLTGVIVSWALFEYDFLSVAPLASDMVVEELPDPVLVLDADDAVVKHNAAARAAFGADDPIGQDIEAIVPGIARRTDNGQLVSANAPDGSGTDAKYNPQLTEVTDQHGEYRGQLIVFRDVTAQQQRLDRIEALQAATESLIDARIDDEIADVAVSFVDRILDQEVAVVFLADTDGDTLRPAAVSDAVEAANGGSLSPLTPDDRTLWTRYEQSAGDGVVTDGWQWAPLSNVDVDELLVLSLGDHGLFCIGSRASGYTTGDRQFARILADGAETALDRVAREQDLRENRRIVRQHTEQLEFLNGVLRHNIRNGMQVIESNADLLEAHAGADPESRQYLDRIRDRTAELSSLTARIRSITDTVTTDPEDRLWPVELTPALREQIATMEQRHDDLQIDVDISDDPVVLANGLLEDVFEIVLQNAVEHNDAAQPHVEIEVVHVGDWIQVHVADNGPGVSDHFKESLFERDVAVSETAHGFGLYFVALILDLFEGDVWFEDNEPRGAIAVLEFQRAPDE
ncbi:Signal-transducing histidine kinase protein [Halorhabdus tiamatea SARL4B]|uniref:PAS/PAC sensor signal transduction histidine kinase n=1 Tax=Halorhabdus tiamatea SARL4B TaxID=1033806 RepID=F7PI84_9EURY|nr:histidine kinase N-terminal 7TM domain-containing protein [Halorhabdus tiamatea]ERJ05259.1 Signal-transducing histidine kinase protein [Halorhabdus tiamatea SARL4B]CCQ32170.1 PAS/PAC sensor signal transduction histidine kinase [Halorhabdus tiamatea SARL4B]